MLSSAGQGSARLHHLLLARIHLQPLPLPLQPQHLRGAWLPSRLQYPPLLQVSSHVAPPDFGAEAACFSIVQPTLFRFSAQGSLHTASFSQLRWSSRVLGLVARRAGWHVAFRGAWWLLLFPPCQQGRKAMLNHRPTCFPGSAPQVAKSRARRQPASYAETRYRKGLAPLGKKHPPYSLYYIWVSKRACCLLCQLLWLQ